MKKIYVIPLLLLFAATVAAQQNQYGVLYTILNTKCQNASCHSAASGYYLKFDGDSDDVYNALFNMPSTNAASLANHELLVNAQMPYASFLLRKIAGGNFDSDLSIDSGEGALMTDINGNQLPNYEIEYFRQWIRYGALETYQTNGAAIAQPDFPTYYLYYNDSTITPFLPKPPKPTAGEGIQLRMGPQFLPITGAVEQEVLEQNVVYFPYLPQIIEVDGSMTEQSHHFLLFQYADSSAARNTNGGAADVYDIGQVTPALGSTIGGVDVSGAEPFSGNKNLVGAWQTNANLMLPTGTAMMWDQKTYLDMDYHIRNYNATSVLPCDFYFNVYYKPRNPNTIPMVSHLVSNESFGTENLDCLASTGWPLKFLPQGTNFTGTYDDQDNTTTPHTKYIWMTAGHTHQFGTEFQILVRDSTGELAQKIYDGDSAYGLGYNIGYWDWHHPPIEYFSPLVPVQFGTIGSGADAHPSGLVANTSWTADSGCIHFGFTTSEEMQLFYYMYTTTAPPVDTATTAISYVAPPPMYFVVEPNPMSNNGKLIYNLDKPANVQASILDITGKTIATLAQENEETGLHEVNINSGQKFAAGIYFAKVVVNGNLYTKKFIVTE